jgi:hypothetical protein
MKWPTTNMGFLENCVFVDESASDVNMKPTEGWSLKGTPPPPSIVETHPTRAVSHTILGDISARLVVFGVEKTSGRLVQVN